MLAACIAVSNAFKAEKESQQRKFDKLKAELSSQQRNESDTSLAELGQMYYGNMFASEEKRCDYEDFIGRLQSQ